MFTVTWEGYESLDPPGAGVIDDNRMLYAAFSEGDTSASGSVVCIFNLTEIDKNFDNSKYYHFNDGTRAKEKDRTTPTCAELGNISSEDIFVSDVLYLRCNYVKFLDR